MKTFGYLAVVLGALMLGVGSHADDNVNSATGMAQHQQGMASAMNGLWISNCYQFEPGHFQVRTFEFVLSHLATITTMSYADSYCSNAPTGAQVVPATWDVGEEIVTEEGLRAYQLEILLRSGPERELTTVKQIVHFQGNQFVMGLSKKIEQYPQVLDWEISYSSAY